MKILSIGMIVKNEEKRLEATLQALQPLRDAVSSELIIADTGSTDGTIAIAERYGNKVFAIPWEGDFAKARNATLAKATGQWFFYLDADEVLRNPEELIRFLRLPTSKRYNNIKLSIYNVTSEKDNIGAILWSNRIFRRGAQIYFTGKIHETVPIVQPEYILRQTDLYHMGYNNDELELLRFKSQRNLQLLEGVLQETTDDLQKAKVLLDYADSANLSKDKEGEQQALNKAKEAAALLTPLENREIRNCFLARAYGLILRGLILQKDCQKCLQEGQTYFMVQTQRGAQDLDVLFYMAGAAYNLDEYQLAVEYGEQYCQRLKEDFTKVGQRFLLATMGKKDEILLLLRDCYAKLGQQQLAWERLNQIEKAVVNGHDIMQICFTMAFNQDIPQRVPALFEKMADDQSRENVRSALVVMAQKSQEEKRNEYLEALRQLPLSPASVKGLLQLTNDATEFMRLLEEQPLEIASPEDGGCLLQQMVLLHIPAVSLLERLDFMKINEYLGHMIVDKQQFSQALIDYYQASIPDQLPLAELYLARCLLTYGLFMEQQCQENITAIWPLFLDYGESYIHKLYPVELWQEENLYIYQISDRFLFYGIKCEKARTERDYITSVQMLKKGLEFCPVAKRVIQVVLANIEQECMSPEERQRQQEMQMLATYVKQEIVAYIERRDYTTAQTLLDQLVMVLPEDNEITQLQEQILRPDAVLH